MSTLEFNYLIGNHSGSLKSFAYNFTKNVEDAEDLLQDTLVKAIRYKDNFQDGTNFKGWLFTIMRNIFINNYRRKSKQNTIFDNSPNEFLLDHNQSAVPNGAETSMRMKDINNAIHELPSIFKQPFMLYFEGYKYHEIADMLTEPLGTIKSRIHFARRLLKNQISKF